MPHRSLRCSDLSMPSQPIVLRWSIGRFRNFTRAHRVCPSLIETHSICQPTTIYCCPFPANLCLHGPCCFLLLSLGMASSPDHLLYTSSCCIVDAISSTVAPNNPLLLSGMCPRPVCYDPETNVIIMQDLKDHVMLRSELMAG